MKNEAVLNSEISDEQENEMEKNDDRDSDEEYDEQENDTDNDSDLEDDEPDSSEEDDEQEFDIDNNEHEGSDEEYDEQENNTDRDSDHEDVEPHDGEEDDEQFAIDNDEHEDSDEEDDEHENDIGQEKDENSDEEDEVMSDSRESEKEPAGPNTDIIEIIVSNRGRDKLCYKGYMYTLHRKNRKDIRWRCVQRMSRDGKCKGAIKTTLNKEKCTIVENHNHVCDSESINTTKSMNRMKSKAKSHSTVKPVQINAEEVHTLPNSTRARLPFEATVKRTLRNQRIRNFPPQPERLEKLIISGDWTTTGGAENHRFLLHDDGPGETRRRVIIFATDEHLELLANADAWYMDGNYDLAPRGFAQLYVLRIAINSVFITVAYALLQRKDQLTYTHLLRKLMDKCAHSNVFPDPRIIYTDFELSAINAIADVLGKEVNTQCCFFHLTQSTFRKVQKLKLTKMYKNNEEFNRFCGMIDALAFLPERDVKSGMSYLQQVVPEKARLLLTYFDETYVTGTYKRIGKQGEGLGLKMRRVLPLFPPKVWNVHNATVNGEARTNNSTEGWNNRFEVLVGHSHPTVWKLIEKMRLEVACDSTKLAQRYQQSSVQNSSKKSRAVEKRQTALFNLCKAYEAGDLNIRKFLSNVSNTIRFRKL